MLLAFDLDSTIVTVDNSIPEHTLSAILAAHDKGYPVAVLTGRSLVSARPHIETLGLTGLYSTTHGALVTGADGDVLHRAALKGHQVRTLVERFEADGTTCSCMVGEHVFVADPQADRWAWAAQMGYRLHAHSDYRGEPAERLVLTGEQGASQIYSDLLDELPELIYYLWNDTLLELTGAGSDKGTALKHLAEHLGVLQADTVAFGDGLNDVTMMRWAGHAVAVGEAHEAVLAESDERVEAPEAGGVAQWLERHVL